MKLIKHIKIRLYMYLITNLNSKVSMYLCFIATNLIDWKCLKNIHSQNRMLKTRAHMYVFVSLKDGLIFLFQNNIYQLSTGRTRQGF